MSLRVNIGQGFGAFTLSAQMRAGQGTTVVFGRSGSGKTTLINAVAGLIKPERGRIVLDDEVLFDAAKGIHKPAHERRIGYMFQDARLFPHKSVQQNLDFGVRYAPSPLRGKERAHVIDVLGIGHLLARRVAALSGGERQRVALGRALMIAPRLLVLDEPLAALDAARKQEIMPYLERLRAEGGPPMIYVTHDMGEIVRLADNLVIMRDGACVAQGLAEDVMSDPANVPLIGVQDAGALVRGRIEEHAEDGLSTIRLSHGALHLPQVNAAIGQQVRLRVRAQDVIISAKVPEGLSTQNVLEAQITGIHRGTGPGVAVALRSGSDRLIARITVRALEKMGLEVGQPVWAILKASSVPAAAIAASGNAAN